MGQPYYDQDSFRWREDDGSESGASWIHDPNTDLSSPQTDYTYRLRFLVQNTGDKDGALTPRLEYRVNAGTWTQVTTSSSYVRSTTSGYVSDGTACTQQLGSGTHDEGYFDSNGSITGFTLTQQQESEDEWCFQFRSADVGGGDVIELRVTNDGVALNSYTNTPSTTFPSGTFQQSHFRIRTGDAVGLNIDSGWAANLDTNATIDAETLFRVRFEVEEIGGAQKVATLKFQYRKNAGTWTDLTYQPRKTETANPACYITQSAQYNDADATTNVLAGSAKSFVAGTGEENNTLPELTLNNQHTEYEVCLIIHTWYDGPGQNVDNDTFEFRLVETDGTPLGGSYVIPTITLNVPAGLIGGCFVETPSRIGPFCDTNGNLYFVMECAETNNVMLMMKSTDGGDIWAEMDGTNRPTNNDLESLDIAQVGDTLHILCHGDSGDVVQYHTFRMSDHGSPDTWGITDEQVNTTTTILDQKAGIAVLSDTRVRAFWAEDISGDQRIRYNTRSSGGEWGTAASFGDTAATDCLFPVVVKGAGDKVHIFYKDETNGDIYHRSLASDNTLSDRELVEGDALVSGAPEVSMTEAVYWDDGGDEKIMVLVQDSDMYLYSVVVTNDGTPETRKLATDSTCKYDDSGGTSRQTTATLAVDAATDTCHLFYVQGGYSSGGDIYRDEAANDSGWGTDALFYDGVDIDWIRGRVFTHSAGNGGAKVVGIIHDRGSNGGSGFIWYSEYEIGGQTVTFAATAASAITTPSPLLKKTIPMAGIAASAGTTPSALLGLTKLLSAIIASATTTPSIDLTLIKVFTAACSTATTTPSAALAVIRELVAAIDSSATTPTAALAVLRGLAGICASAATTPDAMLGRTRPFVGAADSITTTPGITLEIAKLLAAICASTATTPAAALAVIRTWAAVAASEALTPSVALAVLRGMAAAIDTEALTPDTVILETGAIVEFLAVCASAATTPAAALAILRVMVALIATEALTPDDVVLSIAGIVEFLAACASGITTPVVGLSVGRALAALSASATTTPATMLAVTRPLAATLDSTAITSDIALAVARYFSAALDSTVSTPDASLAVARSFSALLSSTASTPDDATLFVKAVMGIVFALLTMARTPSVAVTGEVPSLSIE